MIHAGTDSYGVFDLGGGLLENGRLEMELTKF